MQVEVVACPIYPNLRYKVSDVTRNPPRQRTFTARQANTGRLSGKIAFTSYLAGEDLRTIHFPLGQGGQGS